MAPSLVTGSSAVRGSAEQRAFRAGLDADRAQSWLVEQERWLVPYGSDGAAERLVRSLVVFLTGAECPFSCTFCDLWQYTLEGPTPDGALVHQLDGALAEARRRGTEQDGEVDAWHTLKLYNASNWFDARAVPLVDDARLLQRAAAFERVVVECHPRLVRSSRAERWGETLADNGSHLEVALGLETTHPAAFEWINKGCSLGDFARSFSWLEERAIGIRAFVLVGLPPLRSLPTAEQVSAVVDSVVWAAERGARSVSLIPLRDSPAPSAQRSPVGSPTVDRLALLEDCFWSAREAVDPAYGGSCLVHVDAWDLDLVDPHCVCCHRRQTALALANRVAAVGERTHCPECARSWKQAREDGDEQGAQVARG